MRSFSLALLMLFALMACSDAQITQTGAGKKAGGGGGGGSNFILMVDNTSRILQTDNASKICMAGGC